MATATLVYTDPAAAAQALTVDVLAAKGIDKAEKYRLFPGIKHGMLDGSLGTQTRGFGREFIIDFGVIQTTATMLAILYFLLDDDRTLEYSEVELAAAFTDVAWTFGTGWALGGGNQADHTAGNTAALEMDIGAEDEETYRVTFTVASRTAGTVTAQVGGVSGVAISADGTYTQRITATGTGNLKFVPSTDFDGEITNPVTATLSMRVVPTNPDGYEDEWIDGVDIGSRFMLELQESILRTAWPGP